MLVSGELVYGEQFGDWGREVYLYCSGYEPMHRLYTYGKIKSELILELSFGETMFVTLLVGWKVLEVECAEYSTSDKLSKTLRKE